MVKQSYSILGKVMKQGSRSHVAPPAEFQFNKVIMPPYRHPLVHVPRPRAKLGKTLGGPCVRKDGAKAHEIKANEEGDEGEDEGESK